MRFTDSEIKAALLAAKGDTENATKILASGFYEDEDDPYYKYYGKQLVFPEKQRVKTLLDKSDLERADERCKDLFQKYSRMKDDILIYQNRADLVDFLLCNDIDQNDPEWQATLERVAHVLSKKRRY